jgi:NAD+ kinase
VRTATVLTHRQLAGTSEGVVELIRAARQAGVTLRFNAEETGKHELSAGECVLVDAEVSHDVDLAIVLGGDGTILTALREYAGTGVPVFAVNYGEVGFLATLDPDGLGESFARAFAGRFETLPLPTITVTWEGGDTRAAINDVSVHRKAGLRVADLAYSFGGEEIGRVRADGLVVATPAGSTGYNLANGGPVLAWGVEGFVVSFIAPHSLTARALVAAPDDALTVTNRSRGEPVEIHVDGRPGFELPAGEEVTARFGQTHAMLAQLPEATFYQRFAERFGRLAR